MLPKDPFILLSYVNTMLRDHYPSREAFLEAVDADPDELEQRLSAVGVHYDAATNQYHS
jgi:hypothetical protein